jgi:hypothetical protein
LTELFDLFLKSSSTMKVNTTGESSNLDLIKLNKLFAIIADTNNEANPEVINYRNFIWKLLLNQHELDFFVEKLDDESPNSSLNRSKTKPNSIRSLVASKTPHQKLSNIVSHNQTRGFCATYFKRACINDLIKMNPHRSSQFSHARTLQECLSEYYKQTIITTRYCHGYCDFFVLHSTKRFGSTLILVASQQTRNKVLSPAFKYLDFENLNDLEFCVLEHIGK